jgi:nucleoid-associated protein YgaU
LQTISAASIRELLSAGRLIEARTLLALDDNGAFAENERRTLESELAQLLDEAEARFAKADALEQAGWTEEAKAAYEAVLSVAVDYPGLQDHIKRVDDAMALTKAVQRRNRRLRQAPKTRNKNSTRKSRLPMLLGGGLTIAAAGLFLLFWFSPQGQQSPPAAAGPSIAAQTAPPAPTTPPSEPTPAESTPPAPEQPAAADPVVEAPVEVPPAAADAPPATSPPAAQTPAPQPIGQSQPTDVAYTVQTGDSLSLIAQRQLCNQGAWKKIYQRNKKEIPNPQILLPGMQLQLSGIENRCPQTEPPVNR